MRVVDCVVLGRELALLRSVGLPARCLGPSFLRGRRLASRKGSGHLGVRKEDAARFRNCPFAPTFGNPGSGCLFRGYPLALRAPVGAQASRPRLSAPRPVQFKGARRGSPRASGSVRRRVRGEPPAPIRLEGARRGGPQPSAPAPSLQPSPGSAQRRTKLLLPWGCRGATALQPRLDILMKQCPRRYWRVRLRTFGPRICEGKRGLS